METQLEEIGRARDLYEQLLERTKHVKVWISFARFEANQSDIERSRKVFERAGAFFRDHESKLKEERLLLLENWLSVEESNNSDFVDKVRKKFPKRVKKRRKVQTQVKNAEGEEEEGWEEYFDYIFPEDEA